MWATMVVRVILSDFHNRDPDRLRAADGIGDLDLVSRDRTRKISVTWLDLLLMGVRA